MLSTQDLKEIENKLSNIESQKAIILLLYIIILLLLCYFIFYL